MHQKRGTSLPENLQICNYHEMLYRETYYADRLDEILRQNTRLRRLDETMFRINSRIKELGEINNRNDIVIRNSVLGQILPYSKPFYVLLISVFCKDYPIKLLGEIRWIRY